MSLKPHPTAPLPPEIAAWGAQHLAPTSPFRLIGDSIFALFHDGDFADLYPVRGQPALSPVLLTFVLVLQALENRSDREAATAVTSDLRWKYALHLPLADAGFDASVLVEFRQRLLAHQAEARVFDAILAHLTALGLLTARGIQRTDSLAILSKMRELSRVELVVETLRVTIRGLLKIDRAWTQRTLPTDWDARYGPRCKSERLSSAERETLAMQAGRDGLWLLAAIDAAMTPDCIREATVVSLLRGIWTRHFVVDRDDQLRWTVGGERGGAGVVETPHDPDADWSMKGQYLTA